MLTYQKFDNTLATKCHTWGKGTHQEKQHGNKERKMTSKFSLFFFSLCSCYLKWPLSVAVKISGVSVTCINRLHCTLVSAWGPKMTPAVCHSTDMVQRHIQEKVVQQILTCAWAQSCSFWNQASLCKGLAWHIPFLALPLHLCVPTRRGSSTAQPLSSWTPSLTQDWGEGLATLFRKTGNEHHSVELVLGKVWTEEMVLHQTGRRKLIWERTLQTQLESTYMAMYKPLGGNTGKSK